MKIHGKKLDSPNEVTIVIPRQSGNIIFKAQAVLDFEPFKAICPQPEPPQIMKPGQQPREDLEDPKYVEELNKWSKQHTEWMIIKSLEATEGLEWETVDKSDPETWANYEKELRDSGFAPAEITRIITSVLDACGLNQRKIDEATEAFLAGQVAQ